MRIIFFVHIFTFVFNLLFETIYFVKTHIISLLYITFLVLKYTFSCMTLWPNVFFIALSLLMSEIIQRKRKF